MIVPVGFCLMVVSRIRQAGTVEVVSADETV